MKKLIFYLCFALMLSFSACSTDVNTTNWSDVQKEAFINDFNSTFNVSKTDYVNHQWGMNLMPLIDITNQTTRGVNANGNQWEDQGYIIPDDITDDFTIVRKLCKYEKDRYKLELLKKYGLTSVRSTRHIPVKLSEYLHRCS